jgi:hypothetical protein
MRLKSVAAETVELVVADPGGPLDPQPIAIAVRRRSSGVRARRLMPPIRA